MKLGRGAGANLVALGASQLVGALAGILVARRLGPSGVGTLALVFGLFAVVHPVAAFTASASVIRQAKTPDVQRVFGTSLALKLLVSAGLLLATAALSPFLSRFLDVHPALLFVAGSGFLAAAGYETALNRLEADGRFFARSFILPVGPVVYLAIVALAVRDTFTAAVATVAGSFAMTLVALPHLRGVWPVLDREVSAFLWRIGSRLVVGDLLFTGLLWFDTFCVSWFLGKAEAGIYQTAYNLAFLLVIGSTVLEIALIPMLARARAAGDALASTYHAGSIFALALAVVAFAAIVPLGPLLLGLYGPAFVAAYPSLVVLLAMGTFGALFFPVKAVLAAVERPDVTLRITALEVAVNVPLNIVLIPRMGVLGAAIAAAVAFGVGAAAGWWSVRRLTGLLPFPAPREWWDIARRAA
ncbi:MAG TPA: polysaccharide biosynthesis C-terminal domain-containing protein [Candidatus Thermoplasmatota archaeon]|nr:polysaccharide biosynthesis C-terminal domain-containing protein [Candidatus Thermoplasmatota archaeon]